MNFLYSISVILLIVSGLDYLHHGLCWQNITFLFIGLAFITTYIIKKYRIK